MDHPVVGAEIGKALLNALGLGHEEKVTEIAIHITANNVVEVGITRWVGLDEFSNLLHEFTPYRLVPNDDDPGTPTLCTRTNLLVNDRGFSNAAWSKADLIGEPKPLAVGTVRNVPDAAAVATAMLREWPNGPRMGHGGGSGG